MRKSVFSSSGRSAVSNGGDSSSSAKPRQTRIYDTSSAGLGKPPASGPGRVRSVLGLVDRNAGAARQGPLKLLRQQLEDDTSEEDELVVKNIGLIKVTAQEARACSLAWKQWLDEDDNGELVNAAFEAVFEILPESRAWFVSPMDFHVFKFRNCITELVTLMQHPAELNTAVETLAFQHVSFQNMNEYHAKTFRLSFIVHMQCDLGHTGLFTDQAERGLSELFKYVTRGFMYIRQQSEERIELLQESWDAAHETSNAEANDTEDKDEEDSDSANSETNDKSENAHMEDLMHVELNDADMSDDDNRGSENGEASPTSPRDKKNGAHLPSNFNEMFEINAAVMGFQKAASEWMSDILEGLDPIVTHLMEATRVQEEICVLVGRLAFYDTETIVFPQFKSCLLAALRSTLPKTWSSNHEEAWSWLWDNLVRLLEKDLNKPWDYSAAIEGSIGTMSKKKLYRFRSDIYEAFFALAPIGQNYFKQSSTRLHFIAGRVLTMTSEIFLDPMAMVSEISGLGLRHVGYGIPTELFNPFVTACVMVMAKHSKDPYAKEAFQWTLVLVAKILTRTTLEGSTVVMTAINANSSKRLVQAVSAAPRGFRATWLLHVQVGDQFISPLMWAIDSGSIQVAISIIKDLLTIRADRARYYYGADELFERHPDIVGRLANRSLDLLRALLDGLVWRSYRTSNNGTLRRVNYYIKNMVLDRKGRFSDGLQMVASTGDPNIVIHPVIALIADSLWTGLVRRQFMSSRLWNVFGLVMFVINQETLPSLIASQGESDSLNISLLTIRIISYLLSIVRLGLLQVNRVVIWSRVTFRKIVAEIDQDGNGEIDYDEMKVAMSRFKETVKTEIWKSFIKNEQGDSAASKSSSSKTAKLYNRICFSVMFFLLCMLFAEPLIICQAAPNWPTTICPELTPDLLYAYSVLGMLAALAHFFMLIDLAVFSTDISAFLLVIGSVVGELTQFFTALFFLLLLFGSTISIHCSNCPDGGGNFSDVPNAFISLLAITIGVYQGDYRDMMGDPILLTCVFVFVTLSVVLLMNLLIAQLNRTYEFIYQDMLGYAQLNRASLIVDAMQACPKKRWHRYVETMNFDERKEFDEGDLGLPGCIQVVESARNNRVSEDAIKRYGGTAAKDVPWPEERVIKSKQDQSANERLDALEDLLKRTLKRMSKYRTDRMNSRLSLGPGVSSSLSSMSAGSFEDSDGTMSEDDGDADDKQSFMQSLT